MFVVVRSINSASWKIAATFAMSLQVIGGESQMLRPDLWQAMWGRFGEFSVFSIKKVML